MGIGTSYLIRPPKVYRWLFKDAVFRKDSEEKTVYLTFDDGPEPEATSMVLSVLKEQDVLATFFMLGKNALKHPNLVLEIKKRGHQVANHGMEHLNGWISSTKNYLEDVALGKNVVESDLFRPPYGKLSYSQYKKIRQTEKVVFWDVISGDFDTTINGEQVYLNVVNNVRNGSIIVMHDSLKAKNNVENSLKKIIKELKSQGYGFGTL